MTDLLSARLAARREALEEAAAAVWKIEPTAGMFYATETGKHEHRAWKNARKQAHDTIRALIDQPAPDYRALCKKLVEALEAEANSLCGAAHQQRGSDNPAVWLVLYEMGLAKQAAADALRAAEEAGVKP